MNDWQNDRVETFTNKIMGMITARLHTSLIWLQTLSTINQVAHQVVLVVRDAQLAMWGTTV